MIWVLPKRYRVSESLDNYTRSSHYDLLWIFNFCYGCDYLDTHNTKHVSLVVSICTVDRLEITTTDKARRGINSINSDPYLTLDNNVISDVLFCSAQQLKYDETTLRPKRWFTINNNLVISLPSFLFHNKHTTSVSNWEDSWKPFPKSSQNLNPSMRTFRHLR